LVSPPSSEQAAEKFRVFSRAYNIIFGIFQAPYYAFSQTMMAELTPAGFENMVCLYLFSPLQLFIHLHSSQQFFGLFGLSNRASSMVGPNVIQAIINKSGNNRDGFPFLFGLCTVASLVIWFGVDVVKGRKDAAGWAKEMRQKVKKVEAPVDGR
jgi:MFS-type transporter involved in bile tolerance (Atg22 family)